VLTFALVAFVVAIAVNCVAVHLQKRHRLYDRWFGAHAWTAHIVLLVMVWGTVVVSLIVLALVGADPSWPWPDWVRPIGLLVSLAATLIFGTAIRRLGVQALFNGNFFGHGRPFAHTGVYAYLRDPMYLAYTLTFVGLALRLADGVYLLFALVSLVGLMGVEARVERFEQVDHASARGLA
jgi:protein-S-isoprenylcysteine O-methyltransferase Ste14